MIQNWNYIRFGDLFDYENKSKIKAGDGLASGSYPFYTSSVVLTKFIDQFQFDKTSLIFGTGGNASIHYCDKPFSVSTDCLVAIANDETKVYSKYVFYYLSGNINLLEEGFKGAGLKHISKGYINELEIPLPPLAAQKRIAEILDAADALRRKDQELLKKYDELAQAIFIDMFGDPVKNEKGWDVQKLEYFGYWKSGGTPSRAKGTFFEGEIPWISSGELNDVFISNSIEHITEEAIINSSTSLIEEGSLLLGMYDTAALKSSINKVELCCNQAIAFSKLNEKICNTLFIFYFIQLNKDELKKGQRGVRQKNLNLTMVKELKILNPPKEMQDTFANRFKKVLELKEIINNYKTSNLLFISLIQKAFKGELVS